MPHDLIMPVVRLLIYLLALITFAAVNAAYLSLLERKVPSWFQLRIGPTEVGPWGLLQPVADGIKLVAKQLLLPAGVDPFLFRLAPVMVAMPGIICLATLPFSETLAARNIDLGLLLVLSISAFGALATMLGGWTSRSEEHTSELQSQR